MTAKSSQILAARIDGVVEIEIRNRTRRTRQHIAIAREDYGGAVISLCEARGNDANNALVPLVAADHGGRFLVVFGVGLKHCERALGDVAVGFLAVVVAVRNLLGEIHRFIEIVANQ